MPPMISVLIPERIIDFLTIFPFIIPTRKNAARTDIVEYTKASEFSSVPINIGKFPILPLFGLIISVYMAFQFEIEVVLVGIAIIGIGAVFYHSYNKQKESVK